jgi:hypothetical protein
MANGASQQITSTVPEKASPQTPPSAEPAPVVSAASGAQPEDRGMRFALWMWAAAFAILLLQLLLDVLQGLWHWR